MRKLILGAVVALSLAGCGGGGTVPAQDVPPAGTIWFGTAYDTASFALTSQGTSFRVGTQLAIVANLGRDVGNERITIHAPVGGTDVAVGFADMTSGNQVIADIIPGAEMAVAGAEPFSVQDSGGNVLATGSITLTP